jgi:hypothetical protein
MSEASDEEQRQIRGKTEHGERRSQQAQEGDVSRQVGDPNRVIWQGRRFRDVETGYDVYVKGDRVVIVDPATSQQITQFKNSSLTHRSGFNRVAGNLLLRTMFKAIDVWKKLDDTTAIRYRCFERLEDRQFCVQSADYYYLPLRQEQVKALDQQFVELFIEEAPDERSSAYPSLELAIARYNVEFADDLTPTCLERQAM